MDLIRTQWFEGGRADWPVFHEMVDKKMIPAEMLILCFTCVCLMLFKLYMCNRFRFSRLNSVFKSGMVALTRRFFLVKITVLLGMHLFVII